MVYYADVKDKQTGKFKGFVSGDNPKEIYKKVFSLGYDCGSVFWSRQMGEGAKWVGLIAGVRKLGSYLIGIEKRG